MARAVAQIEILPEPGQADIIPMEELRAGSRVATAFDGTSSYAYVHDPLHLKDRITEDLTGLRKGVRQYYEQQNEFINMCLDSMNHSEEARQRRAAKAKRETLLVKIASYGSLAANIVLFCLQLYTALSSKSLSLFATMADSFMDLLSSGTLVYAGWVARSRADKSYKYPAGKRRILGVGIVIFATLMVGLSIELIIESVRGLTGDKRDSDVSAGNIACIAVALGVKLGMLGYCWTLRHHPEARIFATDHFNDLILNSFGLAMALLGTHVVWYIDPLGGLLVGLFIMYSWASEAIDQAKLLIGATAEPQFLNQLTYMAMTHDSRIQYVDTVRAYHVGEEKYVEIDIVMDETTPLWESHDVGEALQILVEKLEGVQRAHVHIDFDFQHPPEHHLKTQ
ncbi:hypothetical protein FBU59_003177 [Linderina macrospora]|uniref:Uncharacterized protein n=1 Tax=Linderina macrospora TaxID=4868 RepID=A0ACC1J978_9FUNG|nr:hypothetical protein FBU59_003177 [Linderina macrospora]